LGLLSGEHVVVDANEGDDVGIQGAGILERGTWEAALNGALEIRGEERRGYGYSFWGCLCCKCRSQECQKECNCCHALSRHRFEKTVTNKQTTNIRYILMTFQGKSLK